MKTRLDEIRNLLFSQKNIRVRDLSERFGVSAVTIRKDLALLEDAGTAQRVYGGAVLAEGALPPVFHPPGDPVRIALAERACAEIEDGDNILLGSGRTCCYLARLLDRFHGLSVVTNNITALGDLLQTDARVYLIGGEVTSTDAQTLFSSPENPRAFQDQIFVGKAFTSISGVDLQAGLTVDSIISTYLYRSIPSVARAWYLMADSTKFDHIAIYPVAPLSALRCLITDRLPAAYAREAARLGVKLQLAAQAKDGAGPAAR